MNLNISDWDYRDIPVGEMSSMESIVEIKLKTLHHAYSWMFECLWEGKIPFTTEVNGPERFVYHEAIPDWSRRQGTYDADRVDVHQSYRCWTDKMKINRDIMDARRLATALGKTKIASSKPARSGAGNELTRVLRFERLSTGRFIFARFLGVSKVFDEVEREERKVRRAFQR